MSFCERLKEQREYIGMSRAELANILGVTQAAIGNYENGISTPKADILFKVFDALECDANFLFQDEMNDQKADIFSVSEINIVKKYRSLDTHGKRIVDLVLNEESERIKVTTPGESELVNIAKAARNQQPLLLDKDGMKEFAKKANDAPNSAHDKEMF